MVLNTETIEVLYMRNGLGRFHLSAAPLQCEYDHCIHDFARAIEAEVRAQDEALIRQLVEALEMVEKAMPFPVAQLALKAAHARLKEHT